MITIHCDEPTHREKRWEVVRFTPLGDGRWLASNFRFKSKLRYLAGEINTMVWRDDQRRYLSLGEDLPPGVRARVRPCLPCGICDLVSVRNDTKVLYEILDTLARAGVTEISLRRLMQLAANIENSARR